MLYLLSRSEVGPFFFDYVFPPSFLAENTAKNSMRGNCMKGNKKYLSRLNSMRGNCMNGNKKYLSRLHSMRRNCMNGNKKYLSRLHSMRGNCMNGNKRYLSRLFLLPCGLVILCSSKFVLLYVRWLVMCYLNSFFIVHSWYQASVSTAMYLT